MPAVFLDGFIHVPGQGAAVGMGDVLVFETARAVDFSLADEVEQDLEVFLGLARKSDDEGRTNGQVGYVAAPLLNPLEDAILFRRAFHRLQHVGGGVLEGDVEIRGDQPLGHERDDIVDMGVGVDIVHARPDTEAAEPLGKVKEARLIFRAAPGLRLVTYVQPVG